MPALSALEDHDSQDADPYSPSRSVSRGRHRAPVVADVGAHSNRSTARTAFAVATTGTIAVSAVALAGCATPGTNGTQAADGDAVNPATAPMPLAQAAVAAFQTQKAAPAIAVDIAVPSERAAAGLLVGPDQTVHANAPATVKMFLFDPAKKTPIANARVRVARQINGLQWKTTGVVHTNAQGWATYTAKVLSTTKLTAIFDGNVDYAPRAGNTETLSIYTPPPPPPPVQPVAQVTAAAPAAPAAPAPTQSVAPSGIGAKAVWLASQYAGVPYVWGGTTPAGFDCSGLTQYVYRQLGRSLPRTAEAQYEATTHVSQGQAQLGDLIFFGSPGNIYHVGIYAGDGMMWNAPKSGQTVSKVAIWSSDYYVGRV